MLRDPEVSVIIPTYNRAGFLRSTVLSVLREQIPNLEILIIDDASSDGTFQVVDGLPIKYIRLPRTRGPAAAVNHGVEKSHGKFITFLDSDDLIAHGGLQNRLKYLKENSNANVISGLVAGVIDSLGKYYDSYESLFLPGWKFSGNRIDWCGLTLKNNFPTQTWLRMYRRDFLEKVGPLDEGLDCAHDNDFFFRTLKQTQIPVIKQGVVWYRVHSENLSFAITKKTVKEKDHKNIVRSRKHLAEILWVHHEHGICDHS